MKLWDFKNDYNQHRAYAAVYVVRGSNILSIGTFYIIYNNAVTLNRNR